MNPATVTGAPVPFLHMAHDQRNLLAFFCEVHVNDGFPCSWTRPGLRAGMDVTAGGGLPMVRRIETVKALRKMVACWRKAGERIALVPTMGALHAGHRALVRLGREAADRVIVSIFVNPRQFGPNEDFSRYPRTLESDLAALDEEGADVAFLPAVAEMYGAGFATEVVVRGLSEPLEGAHRPGHFTGVATVVTKLLIQSLPDVAVFGEKDYQQLVIVRRLVADLDLPVTVLPCPIVREADGLALSSRNVYLSPAARRIAPQLYATLCRLKKAAETGAAPLARLEADGRRALLRAGFEAVDYLTFRDAETLAPVSDLARPARLLATARLEGVRLLDNLAVGPLATRSLSSEPPHPPADGQEKNTEDR